MKGDVKITEAPGDALPRCPHCSEDLPEVWVKIKGLGVLEQQKILMCPHCRAVIGYGTLGR